jgi:catechol 2,3-dioxygenase-like lactoylglutathione lyase family enzyme
MIKSPSRQYSLMEVDKLMATTKRRSSARSTNTNPFCSTRDVLVRVDDLKKATEFYTKELGLSPTKHSATLVGFETGAFTLYLDSGEPAGPIFEFIVPDVNAEKEKLIAAGCSVIRWEGPHHWLRDPYGLMFNLIEE